MFTRIQFARRIALGAALVLLPGATSVAQTAMANARWVPWEGCWRSSSDQLALVRTSPLVCVTPTANASAVEIATIDSGKVIARDTVNADGTKRQVVKGGCSGWERAHFSSDASRVYLRSELTCGAGLARSGSGMLSISPDGDWLDVQGMTAGGNSTVRATKLSAARVGPSDVPAGIVVAGAEREIATGAARAAAGAPISAAAIIEAVGQVDTAVVQTWIVQRGRKFNVDAKGLASLADAGVPGSVTDVLIGVSYPEHFALQERSVPLMSAEGLSPLDSERVASRYLNDRCYGGFDPLWSSSYTYDPCAFRYGAFGYGYDSYRYGFGYNPYAYGYGYGAGYVSYAPVVVVKGSETPHGRVVNGRGYTRSGSDAGSGARSSGASASSGSGSAGGSGASSGSSSGSSTSSGSGRTAHVKPE